MADYDADLQRQIGRLPAGLRRSARFRTQAVAPSAVFDPTGVAIGSQGAGSTARGFRANPAGNADTDAAIQAAVDREKADVAQQRSGPLGLTDYLNHQFLQRQNAGTPAWEVGTVPNATYPQAQDRVQVIGPNRIRIQSGIQTEQGGQRYGGGSRDINTGKVDAFTYIHGMNGFAPNNDYKSAYQTAADQMNGYKPVDLGTIDTGTAPQTRGVGSSWGTAPTPKPNAPAPSGETRYLNQGGVETPIENLTPQERVQHGVGGFWDTLLHSPASEKVREWLGGTGRAGPALAPSAPAGAGAMSPGLTAIPAGQRGQFVEGGAPFNPSAPVQRAVPVGQSTGQAARIQTPTNASERPQTETTPTNVNKTDLSTEPTPGIRGGINPNAAMVAANNINPVPAERNPWEGF